jgi:hypothetical protein
MEESTASEEESAAPAEESGEGGMFFSICDIFAIIH